MAQIMIRSFCMNTQETQTIIVWEKNMPRYTNSNLVVH